MTGPGLTAAERNAMIRSTINSLALSGIVVTYADADRILATVEREPLINLEGTAMMFQIYQPPQPTTEKPAEQQWAVRDGVPHWTDDHLPAGADAHTDYREHVRRLTRTRENEMAQPVKVIEPIGPGDRIRVEKTPTGTYEARRA